MRVLYVSQYYPPETGAAPARVRHFVLALRRAGHVVDVVTGLPNHPSGVIAETYRERSSRISEDADGSVRRVWLYASPRKDAVRRLANHLSFAVGAYRACRRVPEPDVVVATIPPPFVGVAAALIARSRQIPLIVDVRDDWPRAAVRLGQMREGVVERILQRVVDFVYGQARVLVTVTPGMQRQFLERGIPAERLAAVPNGADTATFVPAASREPRSDFTVVYAGTHGLVHGMDAILDAADMLRNEPVRFIFVGDGVAKPGLVARAKNMGLPNVEFRPSEQPESVARVLAQADASVVTTSADPFCGETIPVKLFDSMAVGRPVVGALIGDAADVLSKAEAGILVEPGDPKAIAEAIRRLRADPKLADRLGAAGAQFVREHYSRDVLGRRFVEVVESVYESGRRGRVGEPRGAYGVAKRIQDVALASLALLVLAPVLVLIGAWIRLESPGPAVFRQRRSGRWAEEFVMWKFRTMRIDTPDVATHLLGRPEDYLTRSGRILRKTSLDELPQLVNILRGDMSIVGPRPALYNQYDLIQMRREQNVDAYRPGLTGWAQVNGRDDLPMEQKVRLDVEYACRASFLFDWYCVWRTVAAVFSQRGAK